jgi:glycerol-3-phosphate dehydrogenase
MSEILERRRKEFESCDECDLLVIGGGITGAGIAREAAYRGLSTILLEKGDYAQGTSSRSSKLVHGGLRYLEQLQFGLVHEATRERTVLMSIAPHLVRPIHFLYPVFKGRRPSLLLLSLGLTAYDALSLFGCPHPHQVFRHERALEAEPLLRSDGLMGAARYFDGATDDARLTLETILDARMARAVCLNYAEVVAMERTPDHADVEVECRLSGAQRSIRARSVAIAAGPWTDRLHRRLGLAVGNREIIRATRGSHVVVDRQRLPLANATVMGGHRDGRVTFAIPWDERVIVGTTDLDAPEAPEETHATATEVHYLLDTVNDHFPAVQLLPEDVISTYAGLRPLIREDSLSPSKVSREHRIFSTGNVVTIAGGKLTTYRAMAVEAVDQVLRVLSDQGATSSGEARVRPPRSGLLNRLAGRWEELADGEVLPRRGTTARRSLPGAVGLLGPGGPTRVLNDLTTALGDARVAQHLVNRYGGRSYQVAQLCREEPAWAERMVPELPSIWAEVVFAARRDLALTLLDVLDRRVAIFLRDRDQGLGVAARAAELLAAELAWDTSTRDAQIAAYRGAVEESRRWRNL